MTNLSRRHLLGCGAAFGALAPHSAWAQKPPAADAPPSAEVATGNDGASRLTIGARIDGKGPFRFIVDTGADRTVVADDIATALGLPRRQQILVEGVLRTVPAQTVALDELSLGSVRRSRLVVPVLPRAMMGFDGYLGLDMLDRCRVTFDFAATTLSIEEAHLGPFFPVQRPDEDRVPVYGSSGRLLAANCRVDGVTATAFVDSGAEITVGNSRLLQALVEHDKSHAAFGTVPLSGVTGGTIDGHLTSVHRLRIHELDFTECPLVIADLQIFESWGLADKPAVLIGMNYLRQFARVAIDYRLKEIQFNLASAGRALQSAMNAANSSSAARSGTMPFTGASTSL